MSCAWEMRPTYAAITTAICFSVKDGSWNADLMIVSRNSGDILGSAANRDERVLFKIALQNARPKAPPIVRKKLRAPVTTARSFFSEVA